MSSRALKCCAIFNRMFKKVEGRLKRLTTIPFPLNGINSPKGMACMVKLFMKAGMPDNDSCHYLYPQEPSWYREYDH